MTAGAGFTYTFDNAGNIISKTQTSTGYVWSYTYDYHDRMTAAVEKTSGGATLNQESFTYDALGRQIGVNTNGTQRWTVFNGAGTDANPYADFTASGAVAMRYLYGPAVDEILARTSSTGATAWYMTDRLGTVRDVVSSAGTTIDHVVYGSFGNIINESSPSNGDRFKFTGREYDSVTGLYYYRARYYDPNTGRFVSQDPEGFAAEDGNLFRYATNNPGNMTDPSGMQVRGGPLGSYFPDAREGALPVGQSPQSNLPGQAGTQTRVGPDMNPFPENPFPGAQMETTPRPTGPIRRTNPYDPGRSTRGRFGRLTPRRGTGTPATGPQQGAGGRPAGGQGGDRPLPSGRLDGRDPLAPYKDG
jgi:RHS repeat-associated protein